MIWFLPVVIALLRLRLHCLNTWTSAPPSLRRGFFMPKRPSDPSGFSGFFIGSERRRAGLTQREVAARLSQSQGWLSRIECRPRQRLDVVVLLALAACRSDT
jgi:Helix-turn-helix domain